MPRPSFAKGCRLWGDWLASRNPNSSYTKRITALHKQFPDKSLKALKDIGKTVIDISKLPAKSLTTTQTQERKAALQIIRTMQPDKNYKGMSLRAALKTHNTDPSRIKMSEKKVKAHLGNILEKGTKNRFRINPNGKLETRHNIYSNGQRHEITLATQKERQKVKEYFGDIFRMKHRNFPMNEFSKKWDGKFVKDTKGKKWVFETNPEIIKDIEARDVDNFVSSYAK
jgi:hypothetical protein